jgi:tRNA 2-thiouridine synthesizing protein A
VVDMPHFCAEQGHALLDDSPRPGGGRRFLIRKGPR